ELQLEEGPEAAALRGGLGEEVFLGQLGEELLRQVRRVLGAAVPPAADVPADGLPVALDQEVQPGLPLLGAAVRGAQDVGPGGPRRERGGGGRGLGHEDPLRSPKYCSSRDEIEK